MSLDSLALSLLDSHFSVTPFGVDRFSIYESKDFEDLVVGKPRRKILTSLQTSSDRTKLSLSAFEKTQSGYLSEFRGVFNRVTSGKQSMREADKDLSRIIKARFTEAYLLGHSSTGSKFMSLLKPTPEETKWVIEAAKTELGFAKRFLRVAANSGVYSDHRAGMYSKTLESMYTAGWLSSLPENAQIWWVLHARESCLDCMALARMSPYKLTGTKSRLIAVPKNGSTRCLSNCRCTLRVDLSGGVSDKPFFLREAVKTEGLDAKVESTADELFSESNWVRQKMELTSDEDELKVLSRRRQKITRAIIDLQQSTGQSFVPAYSVADVQKAVEEVKGLKQIPFAKLEKGQMVVVLKNSSSIPSLVVKATSTKAKFSSAYGDFELTPANWVMYFDLDEKDKHS